VDLPRRFTIRESSHRTHNPFISGRGQAPSRPPPWWLGVVSSGPGKPALAVHACGMAAVVNVNDVLDGHVGLEIECVDRLYLNAYVPGLQVGPQVRRFFEDHLGHRIASPALMTKIGNRFRAEVKAFAAREAIPVLRLAKPDRTRWDDRKL